MAGAGEEVDERLAEAERDGHDDHGGEGDGQEAVAQRLPDLHRITGADIEAHDRCGRHRDAHVKRDEEVVEIHDDRDRRDPVLAIMLKDDDIEQKSRDAGRHLGEHLTAAVRAGLHEHVRVHPGTAEADVAEAEEVDEADHGARGNRQGGAPGCAVRTQAEHADEDVIKDDIQHEAGHRHPEPDLRAAVGPHEVLEKQLEGHRDAAEEDDLRVRQDMREQALTAA